MEDCFFDKTFLYNMNELEVLNQEERDQLLKAPAYISLLAANADGKMDEEEKKAAMEISHIKTFSSPPYLKPFYAQVEKNFSSDLDSLNSTLPKDKQEREAFISSELDRIRVITQRLDKDFAAALLKSFKGYISHVSRSHWNVLASFIDPFY
jgi:hypothetical protein